MRVVPFDFKAAARWAADLLTLPLSEDAAQLARGTVACAGLTVPALPAQAEPLPLATWLDLESAALQAQVRAALAQPHPAGLDPLAGMVVPGCAFAACRDNDLPLAAALLELLLHWRSPHAVDVADFLAFQQRADGACGYLNPLRPAPFARHEAALRFHLPATHAVTRALAAYELSEVARVHA
ncbi:hypothetical protein K7W42_11715 [Deinococcus sp. HMF7604]|uniref:hypothetical protein n=1 Tax=Deinococcus betulae TaxID=2873312 RepID=UPI001CCD4768|nr:hypothetical protein [Deinococcus betulae]MBZ9751531.1 hypothetical protein [Deinococcus betulae]